jgi:hypothetical protein
MSIFVSKRLAATTATLLMLILAQFGLASCEPDEFAPVPARIAHS